MSELNEVAKQVWQHRKLEVDNFAQNRAVALYNVKFNGEDKQFWLVNSEITPNRNVQRGIGGLAIINSTPATAIKDDGLPIFKNTKMGGFLIQKKNGKHSYLTPLNQKIELSILNNVKYIPHSSQIEAIDMQFFLGKGKPEIISSLKDLIINLRNNDAQRNQILNEKQILIDEGKKENDEEILALVARIDQITIESKQLIQKAKKFIRQNAELRSQPILDPWQDEIKRSNLYDKTIAINGGPGTGKTTSLVQRIKFLTDKIALEEYRPDLNEEEISLVTNNASWIFFSPSELLKLFLKNNMISEGLLANDSNVFVWETFKNKLIKEYKLFNTETQNPFLNLGKFGSEDLLPIESTSLKKIIQSFDDYYLSYQKEKIDKLLKLKTDEFYWKNEGFSIQKYLEQQDKINSFGAIIKIYYNLQKNYNGIVKDITLNFNSDLKKQTAKFQLSLKDKYPNEFLIINHLISEWLNNNKIDEDENNDEFDSENEEDLIVNLETKIFNTLRTYIRKKGLLLYDKSSRLTSREKQIDDVVGKLLDEDQFNIKFIGQSAFFSKYFEKSTKGILTNLISEIPTIYKSFRKDELKKQKNKWNYKILKFIVDEDLEKNKRLHSNEKSFILLFINNFIKSIHKNYRKEYFSIKHSYLEAFNNNSKYVIGVDEATDFHIIDLLTIHSLSNPEISSVTYSGDLMQRLTNGGIRDWNELKAFIKDFEVKNLQMSYRQSPTLLEIAESIYQKATGKKSEYISFMDKDENEPKPLYFINEDEDEIYDWISKRIIEIYNSYGGFIPSIAIFLSKESELENFALKLSQLDCLADLDIKTLACKNGQILGDKNTVRVFSLEYIKGLEFEAVFFHKIEDVFNEGNQDLVLKNLYVGLSRASFYLGITSIGHVEELEFLNEYFDTKNTKWNK